MSCQENLRRDWGNALGALQDRITGKLFRLGTFGWPSSKLKNSVPCHSPVAADGHRNYKSFFAKHRYRPEDRRGFRKAKPFVDLLRRVFAKSKQTNPPTGSTQWTQTSKHIPHAQLKQSRTAALSHSRLRQVEPLRVAQLAIVSASPF